MSDSAQRPTPFPFPPQLTPAFMAGPLAPEVFANQMRMGVTVTDFTLVFAATGAAGVPVDKVSVYLAPGMLKQLLLQVAMAVEVYEETVAPISVPRRMDEFIQRIRAELTTGLRSQMDGPDVPPGPVTRRV
jgi:hypothetical protein